MLECVIGLVRSALLDPRVMRLGSLGWYPDCEKLKVRFFGRNKVEGPCLPDLLTVVRSFLPPSVALLEQTSERDPKMSLPFSLVMICGFPSSLFWCSAKRSWIEDIDGLETASYKNDNSEIFSMTLLGSPTLKAGMVFPFFFKVFEV